MIQDFVARWNARKQIAEDTFRAAHPSDYAEIVKAVVAVLHETDDDPTHIHEIDDGSGYQGNLLFVISDNCYQTYNWWYVAIAYGSCSGCDTLRSIRGYDGGPPTEDQVRDYMTLALHVVQGLRIINAYDALTDPSPSSPAD